MGGCGTVRRAGARRAARGAQFVNVVASGAAVSERILDRGYALHDIDMRLKRYSERVWQRVYDRLAEEARYAASLLAGSMPDGIEAVFAEFGVPLLPVGIEELKYTCKCGEWMRPCRHAAAAWYLLGERIAADPLLLLELRGRGREQILPALRARRAGSVVADQAEETPPSEDEHAVAGPPPAGGDGAATAFWASAVAPDTAVPDGLPPDRDALPIRQLGPAPLSYERNELIGLLERSYRAISAHALRIRLGQAIAQRGRTSETSEEQRRP